MAFGAAGVVVVVVVVVASPIGLDEGLLVMTFAIATTTTDIIRLMAAFIKMVTIAVRHSLQKSLTPCLVNLKASFFPSGPETGPNIAFRIRFE